MRIVAVVQARMGSQRLPGKVLKDIGGGRPALQWAVTAAKLARGIDQVVVATGDGPENHPIRAYCQAGGIPCISGSEDDVLARYIKVIEQTEADVIVRLTADCPLLDSKVIGEVVGLYKATPGCMYASNTEPPTWPDGLDCEVISALALRVAARDATRKSDRDTVTRFIARNRWRFPSATLTCPIPNLQKERWVLDSPEDYEFISKLVPKLWSYPTSYIDVLNVLNAHPDLRTLERRAAGSYTRNQRYYESLAVEGDHKTDFRGSNAYLAKAGRIIPFGAQTFSKSHLQFPHEAPLFMTHGQGAYAFDVDGNDYVDLVSALLPNVLGYCDPDVDYAVRQQLNSGTSFSLSTPLEVEVAEKLIKHIPCAEMAKFGKSGSDVTTAAVRVARAFTNRGRVLTLDNHYHGWHDWAVANSPRELGVPKQVVSMSARSTVDINQIKHKLRQQKYAALILEPEGRTQSWLQKVRDVCTETGTVLIFDEVITGFRWHLGGYQKHIGVTPDLATFGKAMANGMPLSALVGRRDIMMRFAPPDNVFYSGTFFGEAASLAAALATIEKMEREPVIDHLWNVGAKLNAAVQMEICKRNLAHCIAIGGDGPLARLRFFDAPPFNANQIAGMFRKWMIETGTLIISSHNICYAHGAPEMLRVINSYEYALDRIATKIKLGIAEKIPEVAGGVR